MRLLPRLPLYVLVCMLFCASCLIAQQAASSVRIVNRIDESSLVTLRGNTYPAANAKNDQGEVSPDLVMNGVVLVLSRSPQQQAAFDKFVADQYDSNSPYYHQWLTPEDVGEKFGPSLTDIATLSNWLTGHGFSIDEVSKDRMTIHFSGTATQVEGAFHTQIHNYNVKGVPHIANVSDPQIPSALASVVVGVKALHNFTPKPLHRLGSTVSLNKQTGKWQRPLHTTGLTAVATPATTSAGIANGRAQPQFGVNDTAGSYLVEDITPYDFATIYNVLPLWNSNIDGTGQTIAVAGTSLINASDVSTFRSSFGLPAGPTLQQINTNGLATECTSTSPTAICGIGDLTENSLDVEWAGAVAKGAQIVLVVTGATATNDPVYESANYVISNKTANILNVSYGLCELGVGTSGNVAYYNLWETAATEGIAVLVATGDAGATTCDEGGDVIGNPYSAQYGLTVSALASTPFNTAVGGTDLAWCKPTVNATSGNIQGCPSTSSSAGPYWNATNNATTGASAAGYIPEIPWNDTCTNPVIANYLISVANYFGVSGVTDAETACNFVQQDWLQIYNLTLGNVVLPFYVDTIGGGGGASNCVVNSTSGNTVGTCSTAATSTGTANGSIPLVQDGWVKPPWQSGVSGIPGDGVRDIPDVSFFASNGMLNSAYLICVSALGGCTYSTSTENFAQEVGGTSVSAPTMAGVMALINQKTGTPQGNPNAQLYALAAKQSYASCSSESGSTSNGCYFNDVDQGTINMPCDYGAAEGGLAYDPATGNYELSQQYIGIQSPNCMVKYAGDTVGLLTTSGGTSGYDAGVAYDAATGLGSLNVANVVNAWASSIGTGSATISAHLSSATIAIDNPLTITITLQGAGSSGTPTGSVQLSGSGYSANQMLSSGVAVFSIPANTLPAGSITLTTSYSGDANYATATQNVNVSVTVMTSTVSASPQGSSFSVSNPLPISVTVTGPAGSTAIPSGTVSVTGGGYTSGAVALLSGTSGASATITIPANSLPAGTVALTVSYSGDANYAAATVSISASLTGTQLLIPTVSVMPASTSTNSNASLNVTATVVGTGVVPTGMVTLSGGGLSPTLTGTLASGSYQFVIPANSLMVGVDTLTVNYSGDANYAAGSGTSSVTVVQSSFTLSQGTATISNPGGMAQSSITINSSGGYSGAITFTCTLSSGPSNTLAGDVPTCVAPASVNVTSNTSQTATFGINTTSAVSEVVRPRIGGLAYGGAALALLVFFGIPARRKNWRAMLGMLILVLALGGMSACGGSSSSTRDPGTARGVYVFTVTATGSPAVTPAPQTSITVTVN